MSSNKLLVAKIPLPAFFIHLTMSCLSAATCSEVSLVTGLLACEQALSQKCGGRGGGTLCMDAGPSFQSLKIPSFSLSAYKV